MAAVVRVKPRHVSPVGYEWIDVCELFEDVVAGDFLQFTGTVNSNMPVMKKCPAVANAEPDGIALKAGYAGQRGLDYGIHCEVDGFSGLTPGQLIYSSAAVAGGQDTAANGTAPVSGKAVRANRIRFTLR